MSFGADILVGGPDRREQPVVVRGSVLTAPATDADPVVVSVLGSSMDQPYKIPKTHWSPREGLLPVAGAACVLLFDHYGDAWLVAWER